MVRLFSCAACVLFPLAATPWAKAGNKVEVIRTLSGSVADEKAIQPPVITSAKGLEAVRKAWSHKEEMPKVDFSKEMIVAVYSRGSRLNLSGVKLDDKGNLTVLGFGTRDLRPGFRFVLGVVSREGVKTVNGTALPRE